MGPGDRPEPCCSTFSRGREISRFSATASEAKLAAFVLEIDQIAWERGVTESGYRIREPNARQLSRTVHRHSPAGRVEIESKEDAKKRGQSSPDRAEALVLAFMQVIPREQRVAVGGSYSISPI